MIFLVLLGLIISRQKEVMDGVGFVDDGAYLDLCVARGLLTDNTYGAERGQSIPMTIDVTWRFALAGSIWLIGSYKAAPVVLAALCNVLALVAMLRLARTSGMTWGMAFLAGLLLAIWPTFTLDALSGTSQSLATLLLLVACVMHVRALAPDRSPLPTASAFCIGLAACIRIEFVLCWIVFALHAFSLSFFYYRQRGGFAYTTLKSISGTIVIAICLAPLIGWNMKVIGVPWPRVAGAPLTLEALSGGTGIGPGAVIQQAMAPAFAGLFSSDLLATPWAHLLLAIGLVALLVAMFSSREIRTFAVIPLLAAILPVLLACAYPVLGSAAHPTVAHALLPIWILAMVYGFGALVRLADMALKKGGVTHALALRAPFLLPAALLLVATGMQLRQAVAADLALREQVELARDKVSQVWRTGVLRGGTAVSDEPGWITYVGNQSVIDLTGEISPYVLAHLDDAGRPDFPSLATYLAEQQPASLFLWTDRFDALRQHVDCEEPFPPEFLKDRPRPVICQFRWSASP